MEDDLQDSKPVINDDKESEYRDYNVVYFNKEFRNQLDSVQIQLFNESNIWKIPKSNYIKSEKDSYLI